LQPYRRRPLTCGRDLHTYRRWPQRCRRPPHAYGQSTEALVASKRPEPLEPVLLRDSRIVIKTCRPDAAASFRLPASCLRSHRGSGTDDGSLSLTVARAFGAFVFRVEKGSGNAGRPFPPTCERMKNEHVLVMYNLRIDRWMRLDQSGGITRSPCKVKIETSKRCHGPAVNSLASCSSGSTRYRSFLPYTKTKWCVPQSSSGGFKAIPSRSSTPSAAFSNPGS